MSTRPYQTQADADMGNPGFQSDDRREFTDAQADAYYSTTERPIVETDTEAGLRPDPLAVAKALLTPVIKGNISWSTGSLQEKKDAVYYTARHEKINFAGFVGEWLDEAYIAEVDRYLGALMDRG